MLSRNLNLILASMSFAFIFLNMPNECLAVNVEALISELSGAHAKMMSKYDQVQIAAVLTEVLHGEKKTCDIDMFQDGKSFKIVENTRSGGQVTEREIIVANPVKSFVLMKAPIEKELSLRFIGDSGRDYERSRDDILREAMLLRAPFNYFEVPFREFLTMPETSIQDVKEETVAGKRLMRITLRIKAFTDYLRKKEVDHLEGWVLFDPQSYWALQSFDVKQMKANQVVYLHQKETLDYGDPIEGIPILRSIRREVLDDKGYCGRGESVQIKSVIFGPTPADEFTLKGCGFAEAIEEGHIRWLPVLLWSGAIALIGLVLIRFLHRRMARKTQAAG